MSLNRRQLLQTAPAIAAASLLPAACRTESADKPFEFFIVSDAHMGWAGEDQPSLAQQRTAIANIKRRFPNIELWVDTGDAHHGSLTGRQRQQARADWLDVIANALDTAPLLYVPGNHELGKDSTDPEAAACRLGSLCYRPYYSMSLAGIHFVSLPQLMSTIYVTQEALDWLAMDLALHRHQSVIIFSHNAISDTTFDNGETAYRKVVNSQQVLDVLDQHPAVLGWFHGHNHQYQIVRKGQRLFVSNGRIGGFNPAQSWGPFGQGHLGGIHVSIASEGMQVRAYSASSDRFLDELGYPQLSASLTGRTSLNRQSTATLSIGSGRGLANEHVEISRHFAANGRYQMTCDTFANMVLNENPALGYDKQLYFVGQARTVVIGLAVKGDAEQWAPLPDGVALSSGEFTLTLPRGIRGDGVIRRGLYYRVQGGEHYSFQWQGDLQAAQVQQATVHFFADNGPHSQRAMASAGVNRWQFVAPETDRPLAALVELKLTVADNHTVTVKRVELRAEPQQPPQTAEATVVSLGSHTLRLLPDQPGQQESGEDVDLSSVRIDGPPGRTVRWHLRFADLDWQVRNGRMSWASDGQLRIERTPTGVPEHYSAVILAPTTPRRHPYMRRIENAHRFTVSPGQQGGQAFKLTIEQADGAVTVLIANADLLSAIDGGDLEQASADGTARVRLTGSTLVGSWA